MPLLSRFIPASGSEITSIYTRHRVPPALIRPSSQNGYEYHRTPASLSTSVFLPQVAPETPSRRMST